MSAKHTKIKNANINASVMKTNKLMNSVSEVGIRSTDIVSIKSNEKKEANRVRRPSQRKSGDSITLHDFRRQRLSFSITQLGG